MLLNHTTMGDHHGPLTLLNHTLNSTLTTAAPLVSKMVEGGFFSGRNPFHFNALVPLPTFIIQLLTIVTMSRLVKFILSPIRQPSVIAEIISGIVLGPTVFGHIPYYTDFIFPKASLPFLNLMSNFGLVIFLFLVGLELDPKMLQNSIKQSLSISMAGMLLPFGLGAAASYALYETVEPVVGKVAFPKYFLFLGVAMSITAFPVLARILTELNLLKTKVGSISIAAAAVGDATSWCLLALVISLINASSGLDALYVFLVGTGYSIFVMMAVRPVYIWILRRAGGFEEEPSQAVMCLTLLLVFASGFFTDALGIHAIFGGFLVGIMVPHDHGLAYKITKKLEDIVSVLFLPLYFALSGLKTQIGSLNDLISWGMVILVIFSACTGKIVGCAVAAKLSRLNWRESIAIGFLMNCKGLVELIVLNLGYDMGILSQRTFAIMMIMALITTFLTVPFVSLIYPPKYHHDQYYSGGSKSNKRNSKEGHDCNLLVCVNETEHVPSVLRIIHLLVSAGFHSSGPIVPKIKKSPSLISVISAKITITPNDSQKQKKKENQNVVNALRLIEITERDSSVMIHTSPDALHQDPVMKMMEAFGKVSFLDIHGIVSVVTASNFVNSITQTASSVGAGLIIIPWAGNTLADTENWIQTRPRSAATTLTTPSYVKFFLDMFMSRISSGVLILIDRGERLVRNDGYAQDQFMNGLVTSYQHIFLLLFGGADDRQALKVVLKVAEGKHEINLNIMRFKKPSNFPKNDPETIVNGSEAAVSKLNAAFINPDASDEFSELSSENLKMWGNVTYTEIETNNPVPKAVECVQDLYNNSLVLVGRAHGNLGEVVLRNPDSERRKVLGDVAEAILLSPSTTSLLVMHAGKH